MKSTTTRTIFCGKFYRFTDEPHQGVAGEWNIYWSQYPSENLGKGTNKNVVLGIRPEDMEISPAKGGNLVSKLYSLEPTGDQTLVTAWAGEQLVVAKGSIFRQNIDTPIAFTFLKDRIYLFDGDKGDRLRY
jgi:ABC-type sugar transport system ATPase subunit